MGFFFKKIVFPPLKVLFLLTAFSVFGQTNTDSYQKWWRVVQSDTVTKEKKLHYLDLYIQKARNDKNEVEEYRALKKKSFLVPFDEGVLLLHKMEPLVANMENDSLKGDFLNRSTVLYYDNRVFREALDFAIQSEAFNEKNNNLYNLNGVRIDIGNIYYHTRNYQKAEEYFLKAKEYYKNNKNYNHLRGYINCLYNLGKTYLQNGDSASLQATINESESLFPKLKVRDLKLETAYLDYLKGGRAFLQKDYAAAQHLLELALPEIKRNGDFTNEHVLYLYLGKIAWEQGEKDKALTCFLKIDQLFQEKKFLNYELREAYDYLIAYYKETGQTKQQLHATESLIALNRQFEKEQQNITRTLHKELDTKKLENDRAQLKKQLNSNKLTYTFWLVFAGIVLMLLIIYSYRKNREQKQWKQKFNELLGAIEKQKQDRIGIEVQTTLAETTAVSATAQEAKVGLQNDISSQQVNEQRLFKALKKFEQEKGFLNLIESEDGSLRALKIEDLAAQLGTNRTTLSNFLNMHKGGFANYLTKLRINQVMIDLTQQEELRKYSVQELSEMYGFSSVRSFNLQFKTETGLPPSYFMKQLELNLS